jgi:sugar phosphate isomerase/epimerase
LRLALFTDALAGRPLEDVLDWLAAELPAVREVELGTGGYSPAPHRDAAELVEERGFRLAALNVSGNPLEVEQHDRALHDTIRLAAQLGVTRVVCMSGGRAALAGAGWFPGLEEEIERYWSERVLPYWDEVAALARSEHAELRLCFELEPGSAVFNVSTFERVAALGSNLAVNLDPSHFFWQSIDPLAVIRRLGDRIGFAHGKDTVLERVTLDGVLDRTAWRYATVGHGHDPDWWRAFAGELEAVGYDGPISIEYEDPLVAPEESILESARVLAPAGVEV